MEAVARRDRFRAEVAEGEEFGEIARGTSEVAARFCGATKSCCRNGTIADKGRAVTERKVSVFFNGKLSVHGGRTAAVQGRWNIVSQCWGADNSARCKGVCRQLNRFAALTEIDPMDQRVFAESDIESANCASEGDGCCGRSRHCSTRPSRAGASRARQLKGWSLLIVLLREMVVVDDPDIVPPGPLVPGPVVHDS